MILEHRRHSAKSLRKQAVLQLWAHPGIARKVFRIAAHVPGAPLAERAFGQRLAEPSAAGEEITIFASCATDQMAPAAGRALVHILESAGYRVNFPRQQWCCGLVQANAGSFERGLASAAGLAGVLANSPGLIVTPSTSCYGAFVIDAPTWGAVGTAHAAVAARMRHATGFLGELIERRPDLIDQGAPAVRVAYHDSCQSLRQLGLRDEARGVLKACGYEVVDLPDIATCCGFGGSFSLDWPEVADRLAEWKVKALAETGCQVLASDNPGCLIHLRGAARKRGLDLRVAHITELVAERLRFQSVE
jgi:Fe-S oxidoreductase